ncbi:NIPSNAP family protein [Azospirillum sp. ST 5-10]|uniref:NIPSNAP family protein n=1 Tax=unclassified Azospirillum TaxID=2630922 RepID=UPI003F49E3D5
MLLDVRTYTARPGTLKSHLDLYEKHGFAIQKKHLGEPLAYMVTESGEQNSYMHIWVYEDAADRARRRAALEADPEWATYRQISAEAGYLVKQENRLMTPVSFAPIRR